ncbi:TetR/AcrR family transcriptional regulator [Acuticoccus kandeliae]|uniref:TetR/AcrR family transcriptional regulator n=1 Tax=Acuticoccus kandeliae TaxID=2073160 RepID=UPI0013004BD3|nr:TetR family transcriptional regulator [Acuticoccus kandeliae]
MERQRRSERVGQKQRTRHALLAAARALMEEGETATVQAAADRAGISRATAYRYFSRPEALAEEAALDGIAGEFEGLDLKAAIAATVDPARRAEDVVSAVLTMVADNEALFRNYLNVVATGAGVSRGARRVRWLREALAPLEAELSPEDFARTINALALLSGIETLIVLKDVCGLERAEMDATVRWIARMLLNGVRAGATG